MKALVAASAVLAFAAHPGLAGDKRDAQSAELAQIKAELKPLREQAYREPDVVEARRKLDAAYRAYWGAVRTAMRRLEPAKMAAIDADVTSRQSLPAVSEGRNPRP